MAPAGDVDADGHPDYMYTDAGQLDTFVFVRSGRDHSFIHQFSSPDPQDDFLTFGSLLKSLGDLNGDGHPEIAVGSSTLFFGQNFFQVYSGIDGSLLLQEEPDTVFHNPIDLTVLGDINGDSRPDFAVGFPSPSESEASFVKVYSGATLTELYRWNLSTSSLALR